MGLMLRIYSHGLYLPHTSYIWMNANDNSIIEYRNRWEFKQQSVIFTFVIKNIIPDGMFQYIGII